MTIGLFGGTFDPIHNAHIALAETIREQLQIDEVWFLVTPQNPWKTGSTLSPDADRLAMVRLAIDGHEGLVASDYEFHLEKPTYSYLTLRHLREDFPEHDFTLVVGGDNWQAFDHWAEYTEILRHHRVAVYPRSHDEPVSSRWGGDVVRIDAELMPISSTDIRRRVAAGEPVSTMVCPAVEEYIATHGLYR